MLPSYPEGEISQSCGHVESSCTTDGLGTTESSL